MKLTIEIKNALPDIFNAYQKRKCSQNNYHSKPKNTIPIQEAQKIEQWNKIKIERGNISRL